MSPAFAQATGMKKIQTGEPILFDYVFPFQGYLADHTRIYAIGNLPGKLVTAHAAMLELQALVAREALPGKTAGDIYNLAIEFVKDKGYENFFMGGDEQRVPFIGHGIGLELDEFPFLAAGQKMKLRPGMVIALEPKLIFPGQGVVGIENTHLVTQNGLERLTLFEDDIITLQP
jgi:Xaa-Pro aminopeptidase